MIEIRTPHMIDVSQMDLTTRKKGNNDLIDIVVGGSLGALFGLGMSMLAVWILL